MGRSVAVCPGARTPLRDDAVHDAIKFSNRARVAPIDWCGKVSNQGKDTAWRCIRIHYGAERGAHSIGFVLDAHAK